MLNWLNRHVGAAVIVALILAAIVANTGLMATRIGIALFMVSIAFCGLLAMLHDSGGTEGAK